MVTDSCVVLFSGNTGLVKEIINPARRTEFGNPLGINGQRSKTISEPVQYKGINYMGLIPILVSGINEQQSVIDSLKETINERLTNLENQVNNCCNTETGFKMAGPQDDEENEEQVNHMTVELSSMQVVVLEQNVPNPFAEQTSVSYFIPEDAGSAKMLFFDQHGRNIKSVDIEKGHGIITVFAQNLSTGTYSYSLIVDGKVMETKKMVKMR